MTREEVIVALTLTIAEKKKLDFRPFLHDEERAVVCALELLSSMRSEADLMAEVAALPCPEIPEYDCPGDTPIEVGWVCDWCRGINRHSTSCLWWRALPFKKR